MARLLARMVAAQDRWARPFGDFNHRWLSVLFRPMRPVKDFLNGTAWLGHPVHGAATDIPLGTLLVAVVLDIAGQAAAADIALVATVLFMLAAAATGAADYTDTDGTARARATLHATLMVIGLVVVLVALGSRVAFADRTPVLALSIVAFLIVIAGAFVGGDVVYVLGNMVSRHAFRGTPTRWFRLEIGDVTDLATLPEATPTKARAGINDLVIVRVGETIHALHAVCSHAGGPLTTGGPALYDQPAYEIRSAEGGGYEVRRAAP
jgi:hypothetical protein